jgi:hypothetical protein
MRLSCAMLFENFGGGIVDIHSFVPLMGKDLGLKEDRIVDKGVRAVPAPGSWQWVRIVAGTGAKKWKSSQTT